MKYLEALLMGEATRGKATASTEGSHRPSADITDKSHEVDESQTFVGNVGSPVARSTIESAITRPDDRQAFRNKIDTFYPSMWGLEEFEERAAIMEYDGGLDRAEAERRAFLELANRIPSRNT